MYYKFNFAITEHYLVSEKYLGIYLVLSCIAKICGRFSGDQRGQLVDFFSINVIKINA